MPVSMLNARETVATSRMESMFLTVKTMIVNKHTRIMMASLSLQGLTVQLLRKGSLSPSQSTWMYAVMILKVLEIARHW